MKGIQLARTAMFHSRLLVSRALTKQIIVLLYFIYVAPDYECVHVCLCVYCGQSINQHMLPWLRKRKRERCVPLTPLLTHTWVDICGTCKPVVWATIPCLDVLSRKQRWKKNLLVEIFRKSIC